MRVLIADGQSKVRFALKTLLNRQPGVEVTGEVGHAKELPSRIKATESDLVLLSWELPGLAKIGSLPALREACPDLMVVALSGRSEARQAALDAGADAFVSKTDPPERLLATIADCESERHKTHEAPTFNERRKLDDKEIAQKRLLVSADPDASKPVLRRMSQREKDAAHDHSTPNHDAH